MKALQEIDLNLLEEMKDPQFAHGFIASQDRVIGALVRQLQLARTALEYVKDLKPAPIAENIKTGPQALLDAA